jgi:hypothetical protein
VNYGLEGYQKKNQCVMFLVWHNATHPHLHEISHPKWLIIILKKITQSFNHTMHPTQLQCTKFQENTIIQLSFTHVTNHHFHKTSFTQRVEHWERSKVLHFENWKWKT